MHSTLLLPGPHKATSAGGSPQGGGAGPPAASSASAACLVCWEGWGTYFTQSFAVKPGGQVNPSKTLGQSCEYRGFAMPCAHSYTPPERGDYREERLQRGVTTERKDYRE